MARKHLGHGGELERHAGGGQGRPQCSIGNRAGTTGRSLVSRRSIQREHCNHCEPVADNRRAGNASNDHRLGIRRSAGKRPGLGTAAGIVQSWSDTQVVAQVAPGATSGNAQVLQNGVFSNPIPFTVSGLQIASVTPNSGASGTSVTISAMGFGSVQGSGVAVVGSTPLERFPVGAIAKSSPPWRLMQ